MMEHGSPSGVEVFNPQEAAEYLGIDLLLVNNLTVIGEFPCWIFPNDPQHDGPVDGPFSTLRQHRFYRDELDQWQQSQGAA